MGRRWGRGRFSKRSASPPDPLSRRAAGNRVDFSCGLARPCELGVVSCCLAAVTAADRAAATVRRGGTMHGGKRCCNCAAWGDAWWEEIPRLRERVFALQTPLGLFTHRLYSGKRGDCFDGNGWIWNSGVPDLCRAGRRVYMDDYGVGGGGSVFDATFFCRGYGSNARVWGRRYAGLVLLVVAGAGNRTGGGSCACTHGLLRRWAYYSAAV